MYEYDSLKDNVDEVQTGINHVSNNMNDVIDDMNNKNITLSTIENDVKLIASDVIVLNDGMTAVKADITDNTNAVNNMNGHIYNIGLDINRLNDKTQYQNIVTRQYTHQMFQYNNVSKLNNTSETTYGYTFRVLKTMTLKSILLHHTYVSPSMDMVRRCKVWDHNNVVLFTEHMFLSSYNSDGYYELTCNVPVTVNTTYKVGIDLLIERGTPPNMYPADMYSTSVPVVNSNVSPYIDNITPKYSINGHGVLDDLLWLMPARYVLDLNFNVPSDVILMSNQIDLNNNAITNGSFILDTDAVNPTTTNYIARIFKTDDLTLVQGDVVEFSNTTKIRKCLYNDVSKHLIGVFMFYDSYKNAIIAVTNSIVRCRLQPNASVSIGDRLVRSTTTNGALIRASSGDYTFAVSMQNAVSAGDSVFIQCLLK
tara:strand:- start:309 stop:1580 length:1272 start_codon:yes stop_codon:yes gene_type:complete